MNKVYCAGVVKVEGVEKISIPRHDLHQAIDRANAHFKANPKSKVIVYSYEYKAVHQLTDLYSAQILPKGKIEHYIEPDYEC